MSNLKAEELKAHYKHEAEADNVDLDNEESIKDFPVYKNIKNIHHL